MQKPPGKITYRFNGPEEQIPELSFSLLNTNPSPTPHNSNLVDGFVLSLPELDTLAFPIIV